MNIDKRVPSRWCEEYFQFMTTSFCYSSSRKNAAELCGIGLAYTSNAVGSLVIRTPARMGSVMSAGLVWYMGPSSVISGPRLIWT